MNKKTLPNGAKAYQRKDKEDRAIVYRDWHRELKGLYMFDLDSVEWRYKNGVGVPVAIIELTRVDHERNGRPIVVSKRYLDAILERFLERDTQGKFIMHMASCVNVPAYLTLFREDCSQFWVYNITEAIYWVKYTPEEYKDFLGGL